MTGVGLGGALPNIISLTSEYAPAKLRGTLVALMFCGFPLGAVIGGVAAAGFIPASAGKPCFTWGPRFPLCSCQSSGLPIIARQNGIGMTAAVLAVAALNLGAILGCLAIGRLCDRYGHPTVVRGALIATGMAAAPLFILVGAMFIGSAIAIVTLGLRARPSIKLAQ